MKKRTCKHIYFSIIWLALALGACSNYDEMARADYPEQMIYMPTAGEIYRLSGPGNSYEVPTQGQVYRFRVDEAAGKVIIPLGVGRGGISRTGLVKVDIHAETDTLNQLIVNGTITGEPLPTSVFTFPASVTLPDGQANGTFNLEVDLSYLRDRPGGTFSAAIGIASTDRPVNPKLQTTIVVINTDLPTIHNVE